MMFGGEGVDRYHFAAALGAGLGPLSPDAFRTRTSAQDSDDRIIYDSATGALYFDADGAGGAAQIQFATLDGAPTLAVSDFIVF